jgi:hypothetical protein
LRRRRVLVALAAGAVTGLLAGASVHAGALRVQLVDAAWTDREYVSGAMGTRATWCDTGLYRTTARGQLFSGVVGAGATSSISAVAPVRVTQTGTASTATPAGATSQGSDTFTFPLPAASLQSTTTPLESAVSFGTIASTQNNQYGRAVSTGQVVGGSGAVSNAGVLSTATQAAGPGLPDLATVDLRALVGTTALSTALGSTAATDVAGGLRMIPGTVASTTTRDACISRNTTARAYGVSGLRLEATSASLLAARTTATSAATSIQSAITGTGTGSVRATAAANVNTVLRNRQALLNLMTPGTSTATMSMSVAVDVPTAVSSVTGQTLGSGGPVQLNLTTGVMTVDLAALTSATAGVNGLPANTEVLTSAIMSAASTSVGTLLPAYQTQVLNAISSALNTSVATITVSTTLSLLGLGTLVTEPTTITFTGTLNQLAAQQGGAVAITVGVNDSCGLLTTGSCTTVRNDLRSASTTNPAFVGGQDALRQAMAAALTSTIYGTSTTAPVPPQGQVVGAVTTAQSTLQALLTALPTAVSAQVNVQADVASPAPRPVTVLDAGELGVTALRIGSLPAGRTAWLAFGSSAAGPNTYLPGS